MARVFGFCGFLSFSLVFCRLGGRLETTLYIHFIRRWVKARRHSSVPREKKDEKKGGKERHSSQLAVFCRAGVSLPRGGGRVWLGMSLLLGAVVYWRGAPPR